MSKRNICLGDFEFLGLNLIVSASGNRNMWSPVAHRVIRHLGETGIKRLEFLYDNDNSYTAGGIQKVDFVGGTDINGDAFLEYSSKTKGVYRVYRKDLAAITITYNDDTEVAQKLMDGVVVDEDTALWRMQRKSTRTPAGTKSEPYNTEVADKAIQSELSDGSSDETGGL